MFVRLEPLLHEIEVDPMSMVSPQLDWIRVNDSRKLTSLHLLYMYVYILAP